MTDKKVPLHQVHVDLGAKMIPFAGFVMPVRYSSDIEEHLCVRNGVGIFDVSHMGEFFLRGDGALELIQRVASNDAARLQIGQAQYACLPNQDGGIVDDLIIYRLGEREYMLVVNASNIEKDWEWISRFNEHGVEMENASAAYCLFAVQGPDASRALQQLTPLDLSAIPYYHFKRGILAEVPDVILSNTGYTGAGGFEVYARAEHAHKIWSAIMKAGEAFGIKPIGLGARDTLRLEMGFCLYGNDIDDRTSPLEAGLGWITKFNKDFIGKSALLKQKEAGINKKLVGFKMIGRGIPRHHYTLQNEEHETIGEVTSGSQSPVLGVGIGLGYVQMKWSTPGSRIWVDIRGKAVEAEVVKLPFIHG